MANHAVPPAVRQAAYEAGDAIKAALGPVFDAGAYHLPENELGLILEIGFKAGMLREVLANGDVTADQVDALWQTEKARRASLLRPRA